MEGGRLVEDSRHFRKGYPAVFMLGHYQAHRCWDLTLSHMKGGQSVTVQCPAYLAYGDSDHYSHFGHFKIPANSPLTFEIEVLGCEQRFETLEKKMHAKGIHLPRVIKLTDEPMDAPEKEAPSTKAEDKALIKKATQELKKMKADVKKQEQQLKLEKAKEEKQEEKASKKKVNIDKMIKKEEELVV